MPNHESEKGYPYEVELPTKGISIKTECTPITGVILTDQIKSLDWKARNLKILAEYDSTHAQIELWEDIVSTACAPYNLNTIQNRSGVVSCTVAINQVRQKLPE